MREQKNRVSKVRFILESFQDIILSRTHQPKAYCVTFLLISYFKVLLEGIYDEDSTLHKLRSPNNVVNVAMPIVWEYLTWDWQVGLHFVNFTAMIVQCPLHLVISKTHHYRYTVRTKHRWLLDSPTRKDFRSWRAFDMSYQHFELHFVFKITFSAFQYCY